MVKPCAVPRCKTGTTKVTEKCSVFKVPSITEQYKKWKAVIPGIVQLKQTQYVCEKHFEERYILRKWIKHDLNGRIIAEAEYARPRLDPLAVPSIFSSTAAEQPGATEYATEDCAMEEPSTESPSTPADHAVQDLSQVEPADTSMAMVKMRKRSLSHGSERFTVVSLPDTYHEIARSKILWRRVNFIRV